MQVKIIRVHFLPFYPTSETPNSPHIRQHLQRGNGEAAVLAAIHRYLQVPFFGCRLVRISTLDIES